MRISVGSIIASAVMVAFAPALWLEQMEVLQLSGVTLPELRKISPALAIFMLSAAAGKLAAIASGPPAVAHFCRLNSFATACLVALCASVGDGAGVATWGTFAAGYALVGWTRAFDATVPPPIVAVAALHCCRRGCRCRGCLPRLLSFTMLIRRPHVRERLGPEELLRNSSRGV